MDTVARFSHLRLPDGEIAWCCLARMPAPGVRHLPRGGSGPGSNVAWDIRGRCSVNSVVASARISRRPAPAWPCWRGSCCCWWYCCTQCHESRLMPLKVIRLFVCRVQGSMRTLPGWLMMRRGTLAGVCSAWQSWGTGTAQPSESAGPATDVGGTILARAAAKWLQRDAILRLNQHLSRFDIHVHICSWMYSSLRDCRCCPCALQVR